MTKPEAPTEPFKRAVAAATRAIAADNELEVSFGPETPGLHGKRARLPVPSRELPTDEVGQVRGVADAIALKLRHHDTKLHARLPSASRTTSWAYFSLQSTPANWMHW